MWRGHRLYGVLEIVPYMRGCCNVKVRCSKPTGSSIEQDDDGAVAYFNVQRYVYTNMNNVLTHIPRDDCDPRELLRRCRCRRRHNAFRIQTVPQCVYIYIYIAGCSVQLFKYSVYSDCCYIQATEFHYIQNQYK